MGGGCETTISAALILAILALGIARGGLDDSAVARRAATVPGRWAEG